MGETAEDLNYDYHYNMFLAKTMINNLQRSEERQKAVRWIKTLSQGNRTIDEMKLRNDFMYYLVLNIQNGDLQAPFNQLPPSSPLPSFAHLLPGGTSAEADLAGKWAEPNDQTKKSFLYENSPDGGAFLAAQPVPRCGAFCYLAVVARNPKE